MRKEQRKHSWIQVCDALWCCTAVRQCGSTRHSAACGTLLRTCMRHARFSHCTNSAAVSVATPHLPIELLLGNLPPVCPVLRIQRCRYFCLALPLPCLLLRSCLRCCCFCVSHLVDLIWDEALLLQSFELTLLLLSFLLAQLPAGSQPGCSVTCQCGRVAYGVCSKVAGTRLWVIMPCCSATPGRLCARVNSSTAAHCSCASKSTAFGLGSA